MHKIYGEILKHIIKAQKLGLSIGIPNILQPGLMKEMIIANTLGHKLIHSKRDADAHHFNDSSIKYEYLSCVEDGSGQLDRMFKNPPDKREKSLERIRRNDMIYFAIFYKSDQIKVKNIYEIEPSVLEKETVRQLKRSKNDISHVGFTEKWAMNNGKIVYSSVVS